MSRTDRSLTRANPLPKLPALGVPACGASLFAPPARTTSRPAGGTCTVLRAIALLLCGLAVFLLPSSRCPAYTSESPEVVEMVEAANQYLEKTKEHPHAGGDALIAMTLLKCGKESSDPRVARAIKRCIKRGSTIKEYDNYSLPLVMMFLCEVDAQKYRPIIAECLNELLSRQIRGHGAWTYEHLVGGGQGNFAAQQQGTHGDTSQTQYALLALWTVHHHGFNLPDGCVEDVCNWLLRTQDPSGAFGYQPIDPGSYQRIPQSLTRMTLTCAGMGTLYICAEMLGLDASVGATVGRSSQLPPALVPVKEETRKGEVLRRVRPIDDRAFDRTLVDGNNWIGRNFKIEQPEWQCYYLYTLERYESFREQAEGRKDASPPWYNEGVEFLARHQKRDGSWDVVGADVDVKTALATLFLIRSTKHTIGQFSEGRLKGGLGLPSNDSKMALHGGRVVSADVTRSLGELVDLLEGQETQDLKDLISFSPDAKFIVSDPAAYQAQLAQLRRLTSHPTYEVRVVAVRGLSQTRDLDNVPTLIYALSDPDVRVAREARDGLRFVSRRLEGFGMPDNTKPGERRVYIDKWKDWYRGIRPDAEFLDPN